MQMLTSTGNTLISGEGSITDQTIKICAQRLQNQENQKGTKVQGRQNDKNNKEKTIEKAR